MIRLHWTLGIRHYFSTRVPKNLTQLIHKSNMKSKSNLTFYNQSVFTKILSIIFFVISPLFILYKATLMNDWQFDLFWKDFCTGSRDVTSSTYWNTKSDSFIFIDKYTNKLNNKSRLHKLSIITCVFMFSLILQR